MYYSLEDLYALVRECAHIYGREQVRTALDNWRKQSFVLRSPQRAWTPSEEWRESGSNRENSVLDTDFAHCVVYRRSGGWKGSIERVGVKPQYVGPFTDKLHAQQAVEAVLDQIKARL